MKSVKMLAAAAAFSILALPALAADLVVKAPPQPRGAFVSGSGWYVGIGTEGAVAASNVQGTNFPSLTGGNLTADGGSIVAGVGYIWNNCLMATWCQLELDGKYQNISGTAPGVGSVSSQWAFSQEFDVGAQVIDWLMSAVNFNNANFFPTFNPSGLLPANLMVATPRQYFGGVVEEMKQQGSFGAATGETWVVAGGAKTGYRWQTLNAAGAPNGGSLNVYAEVLWAGRGVTFGNVFAAGGAPVTVNASGNMNTLYAAGVKYDFGIPSR